MKIEELGGSGSQSIGWLAYRAGVRKGLLIAINLLLKLRPNMGGLGGPIFILQEILDGKAEIPEEVSAGE